MGVSFIVPVGQSRTGIALPAAERAVTGARLGRWRPTAVLAVVSYVACLATTTATAWATHDHHALGTVGPEQLWRLSWAATAAALTVTAVWTHCIAQSARHLGVPNTQPLRMATTWFVPIVGPPAAIRQIGRIVREFDYSERRLAVWLYALYAHTAVMLAGSIVVTIGFDAPHGVAVLDAVRRQTSVLWLEAAMTALLTALAARAVLHADGAVARA
jgi:hypothetical protein